ncbi:MAG: UDP-N-acetylmuramoyl-L-alanyl-D-glutamate--2,6-diaminopimelate ligase [Candidatus Omnitrophica bacterium]|nr:UDP-N-acetylmuramoyl-L-alanyl-D-glutamate--2,6-diaminopimelate ligase [Candidatus Omnitrophota bacterium]
MLLKDLLKDIYGKPVAEKHQSYNIRSIDCDSRKIKNGSLFIALPGTKYDGIEYAAQAVQKGALCIVKRRDQLFLPLKDDVCLLDVENIKDFLKSLTLRFYDNPSKDVQCVAVTGTNGKTTTTYLIENIIRTAGQKCGVIGTINCRFGNQTIKIDNTTPNLIDVCSYLSQMRSVGFRYCAMEVSSHALDQGRVDGLDFKVGVFTNLTQDHLDYHKDMESYFLAKTKLFSTLSPDAIAALNMDDPFGRRLADMTSAQILSYGLKNDVDVFASDIRLAFRGTKFILTIQNDQCEIETKLIGKYNVYNILAASAACRALNIGIEHIRKGIESMTCVPGRLEPIDCGQKFSIFVDYAHTDDALKNVLENLRIVKKAKIILVFGCGGNRDTTKRAKMGRVASELADFSIITNDNPRDENPADIADAIVSGFKTKNYSVLLDRQEAIKKALDMAKSGDVVLVAGKGHETYQIAKDQVAPFDDRQVIRELLSC